MAENPRDKLSEASEFDRQNLLSNKFFALNRLIIDGGYDQPEVADAYFELFGPNGLDTEAVKLHNDFLSLLPEKVEVPGAKAVDLKDCTVVDLGSGPGVMTAQIAERVKKVIPIDSSPAMIDFIKSHQEIFPADRIDPRVGDYITGLPLANESAEIVVASGIIREIPPDQEDQFLSEMMRILKPGGKIIIDNIYHVRDIPEIPKFRPSHVDFFKRDRREATIGYKPGQKKILQRDKVFLDTELPVRFEALGYAVEVEPQAINPATGKEYDKGPINVVITKKSKINNETEIN